MLRKRNKKKKSLDNLDHLANTQSIAKIPLFKKNNASIININDDQPPEEMPSFAYDFDKITRKVVLDVGGQKFTTSLETLTKDKGSMLCAMFSGEWMPGTQENGAIFIDRDGELFSYVLRYLRSNQIPAVDTSELCNNLIQEARYFGLRYLETKLMDYMTCNFSIGWSWDSAKLDYSSESWIAVIVDIKAHCARWIPGRKKSTEGEWGPEVMGVETIKDDYLYQMKVLDVEKGGSLLEFGMMKMGPGCRVTNYTFQFSVVIGDVLGFKILDGTIYFHQNGEIIAMEDLKHNPVEYYPTCAPTCAATVKIMYY
eukprot:TRINITY_DN3442_c2_g1_i1.p1 TRINITY_DN3442_c2_g1~~TRINITY_DN3442_c2_g1_i1.p1  ORF type:complete len:312 (-),score=56.11 TRINITY_DN3442_c2_g1_i1:46-981(-)